MRNVLIKELPPSLHPDNTIKILAVDQMPHLTGWMVKYAPVPDMLFLITQYLETLLQFSLSYNFINFQSAWSYEITVLFKPLNVKEWMYYLIGVGGKVGTGERKSFEMVLEGSALFLWVRQNQIVDSISHSIPPHHTQLWYCTRYQTDSALFFSQEASSFPFLST